MALQSLSAPNPANKADAKSKFENRLRLISEKYQGIKKKEVILKGYTAWRIYSDVLVCRTYKNYYTLHTNGDIEHYEVKEVPYNLVKYECDDMEFIINLINVNSSHAKN